MAALVHNFTQSGTVSISSGSTSTSEDSATFSQSIDPTKTMVFVSMRSSGQYNRLHRAMWNFTLSTTKLTFERNTGSSGQACEIEWMIVEFSSGLTVEHGKMTSLSAGANTITINSAPAARTVIRVGPAKTGGNDFGGVHGFISDRAADTSFEWTCDAPHASDSINYQVWCFDSGITAQDIQRIEFTDWKTTNTASIEEVSELSDAILLDGGSEGREVPINPQTAGYAYKFNSTSQIQIDGHQPDNDNTPGASIFVLEIDGMGSLEGEIDLSSSQTSNTDTVTSGHSPVPGSTIMGNAYNNDVSAGGSVASNVVALTISGTTLTAERNASTYAYKVRWRSVDWSVFTAAGGANPKGPFGHPLHGPFAGPIGP